MLHCLALVLGFWCESRFDPTYLENHYDMTECRIPMQDGAKLFTSVYSPKDHTKAYPILMWRSPCSCSPYGEKYANYKRHTWHHIAEAKE